VSRNVWTVVGSLLMALALLPSATVAQDISATVSGSVIDQQGGIVPGATVVLISEARGTQVARAVTSATGDFVLVNVLADTYTLQVALRGFSTLRQTGVIVSPGDRLRLPALVIQVGTPAETVQVTRDTPLIQAASGERSYTIPTTSVDNLPIASRNFTDLALVAPGVGAGSWLGVTRIGSAGYANVMMDGITAMETLLNGQFLQMNTEAIAEVKVLVSAYQAEYGRNSGIQILSVTKSGTNTFRGSLYDVKRNSNWDANSWYNKQTGYPKAVSKGDNWGYTIGGPIGRPGGRNKLFFFYAHEFRPRTSGSAAQDFRVPTDLEREGNFSQSRDNNGRLYRYIKDPLSPYPCSAANTAGCFQYQGVVGWIPPDRLYAPGMALLNMYPIKPNVEQVEGMRYNVHQFGPTLKTLTYQPAVRVDYQATNALRLAFRYNGYNTNSGIRDTYGGFGGVNTGMAIDGLNNSKGNQKPWIHVLSVSANYNLGSRTFLEGIWGMTEKQWCSVSTAPLSNRFTAKLDGIPDIYTTNRDVNPDYFTYKALSHIVAPFFVNGRIELPQQVQFGTRASSAVGTPPYPLTFGEIKSWDFAASATHVRAQHTIKGGVSVNHGVRTQSMMPPGLLVGMISFAETTSNPYDTSFGFSNVAVGSYNTYAQGSKFLEGGTVAVGVEPYIQDNWKVTNRLTLDYGVRFVHLQPEHDMYMQASQFFPDQWSAANAPTLYVAGCPGGVYPCPTTRQAMNPLTGQLLGPGTSGLIGQAVPGTGVMTNGIRRQGEGIADTNFTYPFLEIAPRVGVAYFLRPGGAWILRGGFGLFYDRVEGNWTMYQSDNPPTVETTTMYYGQLQNLEQGRVNAAGVPSLNIYRYENKHLPSSAQWNIGTQLQLPHRLTLDAAYVGQKAYHTLGGWSVSGSNPTNLNLVDLGAAYLPQNQDPTLSSTVPGAAAYTTNLLRTYRGYGSISQAAQDFWRTHHALQFSLQRRFSGGLSAGLNWNWTLSDVGNYMVFQRVQHNADGTVGLRADQKQFEDLMKDQGTPTHLLRADFVWDLPDLHTGSGVAMRIVRTVVNDWRLSGVWAGQTGAGYSIGYYYYSNGSNVNLTGSPDYAARVRIIRDPGTGCSSDRYRQFNTAAFAGPAYYNDGMESGQNYLRACSTSIWDLAITRVIRLGGTRALQLTAQFYNALNSAFWSSTVTTMYLQSPTTPTLMNAQYLADGTLDPARAKPNNAGFGAANGTTSPRSVQVLLRFSF
jgi:hypothetical protein